MNRSLEPSPFQVSRGGCERLSVGACVHFTAMLCLTLSVYREDCLRVAGLEGGAIGALLYVLRGAIVVFRDYLSWILLIGGIVVTFGARSGALWRSNHLKLLWLWLAFYLISCLVSNVDPASASIRKERLLLYQLPVLLPLFLIRIPGAVLAVRNWFFWAGTLQITATIMLRTAAGYSFTTLSEIQELEAGRLIIQSDTITTAILLFQTAICGATLIVDRRTGKLAKTIAIVVVPIAAAMGFATASRGPLVSFAVAMSVLWILSFRRQFHDKRRAIKIFAGGALVLALGVVVQPMISQTALERITSFTDQIREGFVREESASIRLEYLSQIIRSRPTLLGNGVSSFGRLVGNPIEYPHNLLFEAYYELGIVGLILALLLFGFYSFRALWRAAKRPSTSAVFAATILIFYIVENQFSGGFAASAMWAFALIIAQWDDAENHVLAGRLKAERVSALAGQAPGDW